MNKTIKLALLALTFFMTMHADNWFDLLQKTIKENPWYTATAVGGFLMTGYLFKTNLKYRKLKQLSLPLFIIENEKKYIPVNSDNNAEEETEKDTIKTFGGKTYKLEKESDNIRYAINHIPGENIIELYKRRIFEDIWGNYINSTVELLTTGKIIYKEHDNVWGIYYEVYAAEPSLEKSEPQGEHKPNFFINKYYKWCSLGTLTVGLGALFKLGHSFYKIHWKV